MMAYSYLYTTNAAQLGDVPAQPISIQALTDHAGGVQFWVDLLPDAGESQVVEVVLTRDEALHLIECLRGAL